MPTIQEQVSIAAPPESVFALLAQPERGPEWTPNLLRVERTSQVAEGPGLETRLMANVAGKKSIGVGRCLSWDPPRSLVLESSLDVGITSQTIFGLATQGAGTMLVARVDYTLPPSGLGKLVGGLVGDSFARRDLKTALANLKRLVESQQPR
jgi:uncharacterized protein YndB with AHSA1/START domain